MMNLIVLAVLAVIIFALVVRLITKLKKTDNNKNQIWPFYAKKPLTQPEQILYFRLKEALPEHLILAQVQLSRLLGVKKGNNQQSWLNRINRMSADFVVCNKDASIQAVIELDDGSHQRADRKTNDSKKDKALNDAEIKVIRWQVKAIPDTKTIQNLFKTENKPEIISAAERRA